LFEETRAQDVRVINYYCATDDLLILKLH